MPDFDIVKKIASVDSFRCQAIKDRYDISIVNMKEHFIGDIKYPDKWNIGAIIGGSGTGKSTILKDVFNYKEKRYNKKLPVIEYMGNYPLEDIENSLMSVGFSTPISWLKPYSVLSNGEKMRVDLAQAILSKDEIIIFDEYTSVVDRQIAKVCSLSAEKYIRKYNKKMIIASCHYDILNYLQPDFVFDTNKMETIIYPRGSLQRPRMEFKIYQKSGFWKMFKKYHYLNANISHVAKQYILCHNDTPIAFAAIIHFVHPKVKNIKKVSRIVVHPEWQGIGIASRFLNYLGSLYTTQGFRLRLTSSNPRLLYFFNKSKLWALASKPSRQSVHSKLNNYLPRNVNLYTGEYVGD